MRQFYEELVPMALGLCMRYANNRRMAEEFVQDGFVRVFEKLGQLSDPAAAHAWVRQIMLTTCITYYRKKYRRKEELRSDFDTADVQVNLSPYSLDDILAALQLLGPTQRAAFNLVEVEGYTIDETAERLGITSQSVKNCLHRAKHRLREILTGARE